MIDSERVEARKFRKKPVVIEAMQFDGSNWQSILDWAGSKWPNDPPGLDFMGVFGNRGSKENAPFVANGMWIKTLEGHMTANIGDWIIKGINGEFYPCKPDIFEMTYEAALTADAQPVGDAPRVCKMPCTRWVYKENTAHPGVAVCDDCDTPMPHLTTGVTTVNYPAPEPIVYKDADAPEECGKDCTRCSGEYCNIHFDQPCDCDVVERHRQSAATPLHSWEQIVDSATDAAQKVADALGCGHLHFRSTEWGKRIIAAAVKVAQESRDAEWGAWGIVEVSVRNSSVAEYMKHWEERATKAEAEIARLTARERVTTRQELAQQKEQK
jgi:hypothetical protein